MFELKGSLLTAIYYLLQDGDPCVLDVMDSACSTIIERVLPHLPLSERVSCEMYHVQKDD